MVRTPVEETPMQRTHTLTRLAVRALLAAAAALIGGTGAATPPVSPLAAAPAVDPLFPVAIETSIAPTPFASEGRVHLVYEVHLTNLRASAVTIESIDVFGDGDAMKPLASYAGAELQAILGRPGTDPKPADRRIVAGGLRVIVLFGLSFESGAALPHRLRHRFVFTGSTAAAAPRASVLEGAELAVEGQAPVLGPPLAGGSWVARGIANSGYHRRGVIAVNGRLVIAQRLAIDWGRLYEDGTDHTGDGARNPDYASYDQPVIAVADATVAAARDGIPENDPLSTNLKVEITYDTVAGNHVVLDLGGGRYALYAHLEPGSLRVRVGERVRRGQPLARVGNSGNAYGPHLHFHVSDAASTLGGEGRPYVIDSFTVLGHETEEDQKRGRWQRKPADNPETRARELPGDGAVIRFPPAGAPPV
jgi:murein DD-endopeptidase MepM/ murein hydrolase activator NlpD